MFIDYVPLLLINMVAGLFLLAFYLLKGMEKTDKRSWGLAFAATGFIAFLNGLHMTWHWPLPGSYNVAFGEMSVFFGILFLAAGFALLKDLDLIPLAIYAFFAGVAAVLIGIRIINLHMTNDPIISGLGFILTGLAGILSAPVIYFHKNRIVRTIGAIVLVAAALIWAQTGYKAYWGHLSGLSKWIPLIMR